MIKCCVSVGRVGRCGGQADEPASAVVEQRFREARGEAVVHHTPCLAVGDQTGGPRKTQGVADGVFTGTESQSEVADAEFIDDSRALRMRARVGEPSRLRIPTVRSTFPNRRDVRAGHAHTGGVNRVLMRYGGASHSPVLSARLTVRIYGDLSGYGSSLILCTSMDRYGPRRLAGGASR